MPPRLPFGAERASPPALRDDPAYALLLTGALVATVLLCLRHVVPVPGAAEAVSRSLAMLAGSMGLIVLVIVLAVTLVAPLLPRDQPITQMMFEFGLPLFDEAVTLALTLSVAAVLSLLVTSGHVGRGVIWFLFQALVVWGCYRLRCRARAA